MPARTLVQNVHRSSSCVRLLGVHPGAMMITAALSRADVLSVSSSSRRTRLAAANGGRCRSAAARPPRPPMLPMRLAAEAPWRRGMPSRPRLAAGLGEGAGPPGEGDGPSDTRAPDVVSVLSSVAIFTLWAGLVWYAFNAAPNQTSIRDQVLLEKLLNLPGSMDDGVSPNKVFFCLFNLMGVWPAVYAALLIPSGRSSGKFAPPAWPFVVGSFFLGCFALLPYMGLWRPGKDAPGVPTAEEMTGFPGLLLRWSESRANAAILAAAAVGLVATAATAGPEAWAGFGGLFDQSRFAHVTSVDFLLLSALAPFWVWNDATARRWDGVNSWALPAVCCVPLLGPCVYLLLRPRQ